jgi:deazaflavin-dependent oxidoreductase (nitroreductase family)
MGMLEERVIGRTPAPQLKIVIQQRNIMGFAVIETILYHAHVDWRMAMKHQPLNLRSKIIDGIRIFNKYIFNRITLTLAKSGRGPFSVVYHKGRRSGRTYRTPVLASYVDEMIIIPLSYGEKVDWLRNVLAQGGCEIVRKKKTISAINPEVIDSRLAFEVLPEKRRKLFERHKMGKFLCLGVIEKE